MESVYAAIYYRRTTSFHFFASSILKVKVSVSFQPVFAASDAPLRDRRYSCIDRKPLLIQFRQILPQRRQRQTETGDILPVLKLRFGIPVPRIRHIDIDEHHLRVGVLHACMCQHCHPRCTPGTLFFFGKTYNNPRVMPHDPPAIAPLILRYRPYIPRLLLQFPERTLRRTFACVDQAAGDFDGHHARFFSNQSVS
jgi:hypothetical protein